MKLYVDLHIHSCLSPCGDDLMTPNNIVGMAYLKGLDAIAVCDHNSTKNLPAVFEVAKMMDVLVLPGVELNTKEEVHMLCYFEELEKALAFGDEIYKYLPDVKNKPEFFGKQQVMDMQDEETGTEEKLLISALELSFEECASLCHNFGGLCVPAHINRGSNGVIGALGFLPMNVRYDAIEYCKDSPLPSHVDISDYKLLRSSDAHYLENISEKDFFVEAEERSVKALFRAIKTTKE